MATLSYELLDLYLNAEIRSSTVNNEAVEGGRKRLRALRDGSMSVADWVFAMTLAGYGHIVSVGTRTTVATFKTGYTAAQPELALDVPAGRVAVPTFIDLQLEDSAGTDNEVYAVTGDNSVGAGTSTEIVASTVLGAVNGSQKGDTMASRAYSLYSASGTAPTNTVEFWREGNAFVDAAANPKVRPWSIKSAQPVIVVGLGCIAIYVGATGTASAGYLKLGFLEFPTEFLR